jgi:GDP-L-fucose synthase
MNLPKDIYDSVTMPMQSHINIGTGVDVTIRELAETVKEVVGYQGRIEFNSDYPDGTPRKLLDVSVLRALGWRSRITLDEGIRATYAWYCRETAGN